MAQKRGPAFDRAQLFVHEGERAPAENVRLFGFGNYHAILVPAWFGLRRRRVHGERDDGQYRGDAAGQHCAADTAELVSSENLPPATSAQRPGSRAIRMSHPADELAAQANGLPHHLRWSLTPCRRAGKEDVAMAPEMRGPRRPNREGRIARHRRRPVFHRTRRSSPSAFSARPTTWPESLIAEA
jgi:hypothetical protein